MRIREYDVWFAFYLDSFFSCAYICFCCLYLCTLQETYVRAAAVVYTYIYIWLWVAMVLRDIFVTRRVSSHFFSSQPIWIFFWQFVYDPIPSSRALRYTIRAYKIAFARKDIIWVGVRMRWWIDVLDKSQILYIGMFSKTDRKGARF